ncbi:hypothetical protein D8S78_16010 [Natrialba swarupiae]|nr:hypothetical protein [Natrialba swarupiae]
MDLNRDLTLNVETNLEGHISFICTINASFSRIGSNGELGGVNIIVIHNTINLSGVDIFECDLAIAIGSGSHIIVDAITQSDGLFVCRKDQGFRQSP